MEPKHAACFKRLKFNKQQKTGILMCTKIKLCRVKEDEDKPDFLHFSICLLVKDSQNHLSAVTIG